MTADSPYARPPVEVLQRAYDVALDRALSGKSSVRDAERAALGQVASTVEISIAEELEALVDSADDDVSRKQVLSALGDLAREIRTAGRGDGR